MERIETDLMIPGRGEPIRNATVLWDGPTIRYAGPRDGAPKAGQGEHATQVPVVMPGLWDCHGHLMGIRSTNVEDIAKTSLPVLTARSVADARTALLAGFTSLRDLVGLGVHLTRVVEEGTIPGPHLYGGGAMLSPTAGHGDLHMFPTSFLHGLGASGYYFQVVDGVAECLRGVRNQLRLGARVIKVCASGGVMSEVDHPMHQQFSDEELRAIVGEAARAERVVAAHCHGNAGIKAALRAGCATIDHGSYLDEEAVALLKGTRSTFYVPTLYTSVAVLDEGGGGAAPAAQIERARQIRGIKEAGFRRALAAALPIGFATDAAVIPHGRNARELVIRVRLGESPLAALTAATRLNAEIIGWADRIGSLEPGKLADIIAVRGDPLADVAVMERVGFVMKEGTIHRDDFSNQQSTIPNPK